MEQLVLTCNSYTLKGDKIVQNAFVERLGYNLDDTADRYCHYRFCRKLLPISKNSKAKFCNHVCRAAEYRELQKDRERAYRLEWDRKFKNWLCHNPHIYRIFVNKSLALHHAGRSKYSARTICESIRWEQDIKTAGDAFKINNNFIPRLARKAMEEYQELKGFFEVRERAA